MVHSLEELLLVNKASSFEGWGLREDVVHGGFVCPEPLKVLH